MIRACEDEVAKAGGAEEGGGHEQRLIRSVMTYRVIKDIKSLDEASQLQL